MSYNTVIEQGSFLATGTPVTLSIPSGFDWIQVYNWTAIQQAVANNLTLNTQFFYQSGMPVGSGIFYNVVGNTTGYSVAPLAVGAGFTPFSSAGKPISGNSTNSSLLPFGGSYAPLSAPVATTASSNATNPVINTGNTTGLYVGAIIRLAATTNALDLSGIDFSVAVVNPGVSFTITDVLQNVPGAVGGAGKYSIVQYNPLYYPALRTITKVATGASTVFTTSVPSNFQPGQIVRVNIPQTNAVGTSIPLYGSISSLDGVLATVTAVNDALGAQTVTTNLDSTGLAFAFPTAAQAAAQGYSQATLVPVAADTAYIYSQVVPPIVVATNTLVDATVNIGMYGVILGGAAVRAGGAGAGTPVIAGPAGSAIIGDPTHADLMYWQAGKSFSVVGSQASTTNF